MAVIGDIDKRAARGPGPTMILIGAFRLGEELIGGKEHPWTTVSVLLETLAPSSASQRGVAVLQGFCMHP